MKIESQVECPVFDSLRVRQIAGMFDLPILDRSCEQFSVEIPGTNEPWQIGLIVGPSGSGKSAIARQAFGDAFIHDPEKNPWPSDCAVIDAIDDADIHTITHTLTAVGFSSPRAWLRPYQVLSNGEKFRCDLARLLLAARHKGYPLPQGVPNEKIAVMDEFTSVVDRTVAKVCSAALSRAIRSSAIKTRFVAVSCHYDIINWLCPDWVVDMAQQSLARGRLCRPKLAIKVHRCRKDLWPRFSRYHYLNHYLPVDASCWTGLLDDEPVVFAALSQVAGYTGYRRFSRIVVLPDYQGIGIGSAFRDAVARLEAPACRRLSLVTSHPAMIHSCQQSVNWKLDRIGVSVPDGARLRKRAIGGVRRICCFVYTGNSVGQSAALAA
jgi:GNAT superfamily N-acetyltransferase